MRVASMFETDKEIMVVIAIEKEPLKLLKMVDEVKLADILEEEVVKLIQEQISSLQNDLNRNVDELRALVG
jgi:hypothetical protein